MTAAPSGGRRSFTDVGVDIKILTAVRLAALVALAVGIVGLLALGDTRHSAQRVYGSNVAGTRAVGEIEASIATRQAAVDLTRPAGDLTDLVNGFRH